MNYAVRVQFLMKINKQIKLENFYSFHAGKLASCVEKNVVIKIAFEEVYILFEKKKQNYLILHVTRVSNYCKRMRKSFAFKFIC